MRGKPAGCLGIVRLGAVLESTAIVYPDGFSRLGVETMDEHPLHGPDPGGKPYLAVLGHRAAPNRPQRNHATIAQYFPGRRRAPKFPEQFAGVRLQAIKKAVVRSHEDTVVQGGGGEANGAFGQETPGLFAGGGVIGGHRIRPRGTDEQLSPRHDGFVSLVELEAMVLVCGNQGRQAQGPLQIQLCGQGFRRCSRSAGVVSPHGPVFSTDNATPCN